MTSTPAKLNLTDAAVYQVVMAACVKTGVCKLSTRQIAERVGRTRKTVATSLGRLATSGTLVKVLSSTAGRPTHWAIAPNLARTTPRGGEGNAAQVGDLFRRRDLHGPGALYAELPQDKEFTAADTLQRTTLTGRARTIDWWLLVLASQYWPLVDECIPSNGDPSVWRKFSLTPEQWQENCDHVNSLAQSRGGMELMTQARMKRLHQGERFVGTIRSALPRAY